MSRTLDQVITLFVTGPFVLLIWAFSLLLSACALALLVAAPSFFWTLGYVPWQATGELTELLTGLGIGLICGGGAAFLSYCAWQSLSATWAATGMLGESVRDVADTAREESEVRAQEAERLASQGGQISLSVGTGADGGLSQVASAEDGLELADEGVSLDLGDRAHVYEEHDTRSAK